MKSLDHSHILSLLGVLVGPDLMPQIITPFMKNGSLKTYLGEADVHQDLLIKDTANPGLVQFESMFRFRNKACIPYLYTTKICLQSGKVTLPKNSYL